MSVRARLSSPFYVPRQSNRGRRCDPNWRLPTRGFNHQEWRTRVWWKHCESSNFKHCSNLAVFVTEIWWYSARDFQIDSYHVLSAAHCFAPFHPRMFKVRVGVTNTSQTVGGQSIPVDDVISHPSYDYDDMTRRQGLHDIAVIRLTHSIKWTDQRLIFSLRRVGFF